MEGAESGAALTLEVEPFHVHDCLDTEVGARYHRGQIEVNGQSLASQGELIDLALSGQRELFNREEHLQEGQRSVAVQVVGF